MGAGQGKGARVTVVQRSFCRVCTAGCGILVTTDGDRVVKVIGDPEHPVSHGYTCPKGRAAAEIHDRPDRFDHPMIRHDGELVPVTWDEALDDIAARLLAVRDEHGVDAIAMYQGTQSYYDAGSMLVPPTFLGMLGTKSYYTSSSVDCPGKFLVQEMVSGLWHLFPAVDHDTVELLVYIGTNPVVSHGQFSQHPDPVTKIRTIARRGEVWVIDTRRTETARLATRYLAPRVGTDYAILGFLVRELLRDGADHEFIRDHTVGIETLTQAVERFDLDTAVHITGLEPSDLGDLLASIRRFRRVVVETGTGVTMSAAANVTEWLKWALEAVTGTLDRESSGRWFNPGWLSSPPSAPMVTTDGRAGPGPRSRPEIPRRWDQYPCSAMADEMEHGHVRALMVLAGNPIVAIPDTERMTAALRGLDLVVAWDVVPTATTELATHVLPCVDWFERSDMIGATSMALPAILTQYTPAMVPPRAERKPLWWSFAQLGRRMGINAMPAGLDPDTATSEDVFRVLTGAARVSFEDLQAANGPVLLGPPEYGWVRRWLLPEGRFRIAPEALVAQLDTIEPPDGLVLQNRRQLRHTNSTLADPDDRHDRPTVHLNPLDAADAGVHDAQLVRVTSATGSMVATALVNDDIRRGAVSIPHGFADANVSTLTSTRTDVDPLTGMVLLVGVPVKVEPVPV